MSSSKDWIDDFIAGLETPEVTWEMIDVLDNLIDNSTLDPFKKQYYLQQINIHMEIETYYAIKLKMLQNQPNLQQLDYLPGTNELIKQINWLIKTKK